MIPPENPEETIVSSDTIQCLPVEDVKGSQPVYTDSSQPGKEFIHPFGEEARRRAHRAWGFQFAGGSPAEPKGPVGVESEEDLSKNVGMRKVDKLAPDLREGWERIEGLSIDPDMQARAGLNKSYIAELVERVEAGDQIPLIDVIKQDRKVSSGVHRLKALMAVTEKVQAGQIQVDALGYPVSSDGLRICVRYDEIPEGVDPMIHCYRQNTTHGLRPSPEDTKWVIEAYYKKDPGCPAAFFAEELRIGIKAAESYVRSAREAWKKEREHHIKELRKAGLTQQQIAEGLQKKWPHAPISQALISKVLSETGNKSKGDTRRTTSREGSPSNVSNMARSGRTSRSQQPEHFSVPEPSTPAPEHLGETANAPSAFRWGMSNPCFRGPDESYEIWINGLGTLTAEQYQVLRDALGQVERICGEIEAGLNKVKIEQILGEPAEISDPEVV